MMYGVWAMRRTNIYLSDEQLEVLRRLGERRGQPVSVLIREALDAWMEGQGVRVLHEDEWERRFGTLLERRAKVARSLEASPDEVERDVTRAIRDVRRMRAARRR
jgi:predicted DNA-binding protein